MLIKHLLIWLNILTNRYVVGSKSMTVVFYTVMLLLWEILMEESLSAYYITSIRFVKNPEINIKKLKKHILRFLKKKRKVVRLNGLSMRNRRLL